MSIYGKRIDGSIITPKDDRILFDAIFEDYGLIYGGSAKMIATNKINVEAARGFIKGTEVIIEEEDIAVELSDSGTKNGRLKIVIDYNNTENPIAFTSEVAKTLPELKQDNFINYTNGVYEVAYATYTASETTISNVKLVMPTIETVKKKLVSLNANLSGLRTDLNSHVSNKSNPHGVTKGQIGLGNVDNTADAEKSVKYANRAYSAEGAGYINDGKYHFSPSDIVDRLQYGVRYLGLYEQEITLAGGGTFFQEIPSAYQGLGIFYEINCSGNSLNFIANMEKYAMAVKNISSETLSTVVQVYCFGRSLY